MKRNFLRRREGLVAVTFLLPSAIGFALFYLIPFGMGLVYSVLDRTVGGSFVGLSNYQELLSSDSFRKAASNTFWFTTVNVPLMLLLSLGIALVLNRNLYLRQFLRMAYVLPLVVPVASIVMVWQVLFDWNGSLNAWLYAAGLEQVDWMKSVWARSVITIFYLWKHIGYNIILFLAGLQSIPRDYYETADLEGAGKWRQCYGITLVYLTPTMVFVILMSIMNTFKIFRETYLIAGDYPHDSIYTLQHYMNNMFFAMDVQKLSAAAAMMVIVIFIIVTMLLRLEKRYTQFME
ncbi:sugar ABC transporter permease [Paenibacillus sp. ACRRX]|uniref:carbohydrate ABC transporter permease n=1 Tax=Paenibacillus sp. ACRRX TaxID=2918206 RepID=UPI001EF4A962|nr:sugar ABC transporter permease [Paenibacillus sp. ACRRX]MCG7409444.1 sugar ABC transporter permease [Paenibacillus sp. ACRRX]